MWTLFDVTESETRREMSGFLQPVLLATR
jgi:hypothetical protein